MDGSRGENILAERRLVDDGRDGGSIRRRGWVIERKALEIAAELPRADGKTKAVRRRRSDAGRDLFVGHGIVPLPELLFLPGREQGEATDGSWFTHKGRGFFRGE